MHDGQADDYLAWIGARKPDRPDAAALAELTRRHLATVPFENLSIHLGEPIALDEDAFLDKLVTRRRGGFYTAQRGVRRLLAQLGYDVTLLAARVFGPGGGLGPPPTISRWWALAEDREGDPGGGAVAGRRRVRVASSRSCSASMERDDQTDPLGTVRLVETGDGDLDVLLDGTPQYRLDLRPRELDEFEATCWFQQTHPTSHFASSLVCSLPTDDGRVTLSERLLVTTAGVSAPR